MARDEHGDRIGGAGLATARAAVGCPIAWAIAGRSGSGLLEWLAGLARPSIERLMPGHRAALPVGRLSLQRVQQECRPGTELPVITSQVSLRILTFEIVFHG